MKKKFLFSLSFIIFSIILFSLSSIGNIFNKNISNNIKNSPILNVSVPVVDENSVEIPYFFDSNGYQVLELQFQHENEVNFLELEDGNHTISQTNLEWGNIYDDWMFSMSYINAKGNNETKNVLVDPFKIEITRASDEVTSLPNLIITNNKITHNSSVIEWIVNDPNKQITSIILNYSTSANDNLIKFDVTNLNKAVISKLKPNTIYDDWYFEMTYRSPSGRAKKQIIVDSFTTLKRVPFLTINNVIPGNGSVTIKWTIIDPDDAITLITLNRLNISFDPIDVTDQTSITIDGLKPEILYTNFYFEFNYNVGLKDEQKTIWVQEFTTPKEIPTLEVESVSAIQDSVTIEWTIIDRSDVIQSIILVHPGVGSGSTDVTNITSSTSVIAPNSITIDGLNSGTNYSDWAFKINYNLGLGDVSEEVTINSFTTLKQIPTLEVASVSTIQNSVTINLTIIDPNDAIESIVLVHPGVGSGSTNIDESLNSITINGLESGTNYNDWSLKMTYNIDLGDVSKTVKINPFTTLKQIPTLSINDVAISTNNIAIDWTLKDPNGAIESIILVHQGIGSGSSDVTDKNNITIENLDSGTTYNGWYFEMTYNLGSGIIHDKVIIESFTTLKQTPTLEVTSVSTIQDSVTINWIISDPNDAIESIILFHPDIGTGSTNIDKSLNSITIDGLNSGIHYSDWAFKMTYNLGLESVSETVKIASFTTLKHIPTLAVDSIAINSNNVTLDWTVIDPNGAIESVILVHPGVGSGSSDVTNLNNITINGLNSWTTYNDWAFEMTYNLGLVSVSETVKIASFTTLKHIPTLTINNVVINNNSITIDWTIIDPNDAIESIVLFHPGFGSGSTNIAEDSNSITIDELTYETNYNDWAFEMTYNLGLESVSETIVIDSFATLKQIPTLDVINISANQNNVTFDWSVNDPNSAIESIVLVHPGVGSGSTDVTNFNNITIDNLNSGTTYNDWAFKMTYNLGLESVSETVKIASFTTLKQIPTLTIDNVVINSNNVVIDWTIDDPNSAIESIVLVHPGVGSGSTDVTDFNKITIDQLTPETNYSDWTFEITYNLGLESVSETVILEDFTTSVESVIINKYTYSILILVLILLFNIFTLLTIRTSLMKKIRKNKVLALVETNNF